MLGSQPAFLIDARPFLIDARWQIRDVSSKGKLNENSTFVACKTLPCLQTYISGVFYDIFLFIRNRYFDLI